jgi:hypothetical protein
MLDEPAIAIASDAARRTARAGAMLLLIGALVSGPIAFALVQAIHPQPPWAGAARFVAAAHPIQIVPYLTGLVLVAGFVLVIAGLHARSRPSRRARATAALACVIVYAALVGLNYVVQTTFVPGLAARYAPEDAPVLAALTMSNPRSLGWALEMWGYGWSGAATWLIAPTLRRSRRGRVAARLFVANGVVSGVGALATVAWPGWVMSGAGLVMFAAWNVLVVVMTVAAWIALAPPRRTFAP